jgi:hypothetical protein
MTRILCRVSLALSLTVPLLASTFHYGVVTFQPTESMAFTVDSADPAKPMTVIALTDFKINRADAIAAIDASGSILQQAANETGNVVFVRLSKPGKCGISGYLGKRANQFDFGDSFVLKDAQATANHVTGNCATTTPGKIFADAFDFNLSYNAPITDIPRATKLAAGGGDPGAAYSALVKALQSQTWDVASAHVEEQSVRLGKPKTAADMKEWFYEIGLNYPKEATITGGSMKGDRAFVDVTGKDRDGKGIHGTAAMKKVDGNWRVIDQSMYTNE